MRERVFPFDFFLPFLPAAVVSKRRVGMNRNNSQETYGLLLALLIDSSVDDIIELDQSTKKSSINPPLYLRLSVADIFNELHSF